MTMFLSSKRGSIFVIAEMACSHEGDAMLARKIIDGAAAAEADAVQLQVWSLVHMMAPQRKEFELLKRIEIPRDEWAELVQYTRAKYPKMQVYVCVYEHSSIDFIESLGVDGYKLNSSDLSNPRVLEKVAATGKPINLSIGASTLGEIQAAVERIQTGSASKITLMYGHQSFPTRPENVNLSYMTKLRELFELPMGYQDHCDAETEAGFWLPAASVGMGIDVLEKHITHDRSYRGIDHESALNPDEFVRFVEMVRILDRAKGCATPRPFSEDEKKYREFQKKSIVAARDLSAGKVLTHDDLTFMRAERLGFAPDKLETIIGKVVMREITAFQPLSEGDVT
jgi:N,N'-diacetyllegionaminate synthase